jgi:hypothetical protein
MRLVLSATLVALCLVAAPVFAASAPLSTKADASSFPSAKARIEKDLKDGKTYSELTARQKEDVVDALERIEAILEGAPSVESLSTDDKLQLVNDQEFVNTVLTKAADDSRLICKQERKTGSHRMAPRCRTMAQIRKDREDAQEIARRSNLSNLRPPAE